MRKKSVYYSQNKQINKLHSFDNPFLAFSVNTIHLIVLYTHHTVQLCLRSIHNASPFVPHRFWALTEILGCKRKTQASTLFYSTVACATVSSVASLFICSSTYSSVLILFVILTHRTVSWRCWLQRNSAICFNICSQRNGIDSRNSLSLFSIHSILHFFFVVVLSLIFIYLLLFLFSLSSSPHHITTSIHTLNTHHHIVRTLGVGTTCGHSCTSRWSCAREHCRGGPSETRTRWEGWKKSTRTKHSCRVSQRCGIRNGFCNCTRAQHTKNIVGIVFVNNDTKGKNNTHSRHTVPTGVRRAAAPRHEPRLCGHARLRNTHYELRDVILRMRREGRYAISLRNLWG